MSKRGKKSQGRQEYLPGDGMKPKLVPEIDRAVEKYVEVRDSRMDLTEKEVEARDEVAGLMAKHELKRYRSDGYDVTLLPKVKVSKVKEPKPEGERARERIEV